MSSPSGRGALLILSALVAACAEAPSQTTSPAPQLSPPPVALRNWENPALRDALTGLGAGPVDLATPLSANEALAAALAFNPDLDVQRAQLALARAEVMQAQQRPNPVLSLTPEHLLGAANGVSPWVIALSLVWPLRTAGKRDLQIEQALATSDATLLNGASTVWGLRTTVRGAVCSLEIANAQRSLAEQEAALRADLSQRLARQAEAGIASRYDSMRSQLERDQSLHRLRLAQSEMATALHDLADVTGLPAAEIQRRTIGDDCLQGVSPDVQSLATLQERAIASRLDLRAKLAEYRAVDAAFRTEIKRRTPDLNLGPGYTYDQGDRRITFTLSGELPIYSHNDAAIARASADRDRVIAEFEKLQWSVHSGVERALDQLQLGERQLEDSQRVVREAQELLERDRKRQLSGELDQPAVIASQLIEINAQLDSLDTVRTFVNAVTALEAAVQTPLAPPLFDAAAATRIVSPDTPTGTANEAH